MADTSNDKNFVENLKVYLKGVKTEWGKITWPNRQQVIVETLYVIVVTAIFTTMIFCLDKIFEWALSKGLPFIVSMFSGHI